jgi:hypothetical protein
MASPYQFFVCTRRGYFFGDYLPPFFFLASVKVALFELLKFAGLVRQASCFQQFCVSAAFARYYFAVHIR